jgi:predicted Rossmann fold flavoprotein
MVDSSNSVAIIGAGASGLLAATYLSRANIPVTLYEKNHKLAKKLLATGNGKCNITNHSITIHNYHSSSELHSFQSCIDKFDFLKCEQFFSSLGIPFTHNEQGRVYPLSLSAASIVDAFEFELKQNNAKTYLNTCVETIEFDQSKGLFLLNEKDYYKYLIIATGSGAMKKLGSSTSGYEFAQKFGHDIIEPFPSLVQLECSNTNLDIVKGLKITAKVNNTVGDVLFTKYGLSGSAILDISRDISYKLQFEKNVNITLDIFPQYSKEKLLQILKKRQQQLGNRDIIFWLDGLLHKKLSHYIILHLKLNTKVACANDLSIKQLRSIVHCLKSLPFSVFDTHGFEHCEVAAGGINTTQIDAKTMESRKQKNLYFTGEVLDIDGDCGGYNLHFAWSSGYVASQNIIQKINSSKKQS